MPGAVVGGVVFGVAVVGVVVTGGTVVVTGGAVTEGGAGVRVTGVVVVGAVSLVVGTSVKMTSDVGTVVTGARATVVEDPVVARVAGAGTVGATATVVGVVPLGAGGSAGTSEVNRLPTRVVDVAFSTTPGVTLGRVAFTRGRLRDGSREVAAITSTTATARTPHATRALTRAVLLVPRSHSRSRSCAGGRPNAAVLPMDDRKRYSPQPPGLRHRSQPALDVCAGA